jgi:hypothetical protein
MIASGKEISMSRLPKFLAAMIVVIFLLACRIGSQPLSDAESMVATAQALGSLVPPGTLEALGTDMPDFGNTLDPEGTPVQEWKGIPIMPQATAGQEFPEKNAYSFKANVTMQDVEDFYTEKLTALGWDQPYDIPNDEDAGLMIFQKETSTLAVAITAWEDYSVVVLSLQ